MSLIQSLAKFPIARLLQNYASYGIEGYSERDQRRMRLVNWISLYGGLTAVGFIILYMVYDADGLRSLIIITAFLMIFSLALPFLNRFGELASIFGLSAIWMPAVTYLTYALSNSTGFQFTFITMSAAAPLAFGYERKFLATGFAALAVVLFIIAEIFFVEPAPFVDISPVFLEFVWFSYVIMNTAIIFVIVVYSLRAAFVAETALQREYERSEHLLDNLLPGKIAARLKNETDQIIADDFSEVTILFADIVDFTPRSMTMPASELVSFLNCVFTEFDRLADKRDLEKIKTIGDAYMVAAGLPELRKDHAHAIAGMALDMIEACKQLTRTTGQEVQVRIGLHTGPVVAGVIGTKKFFYDVWGETVNIAARMESHGTPGRIQVTESTRNELKGDFLFEDQGEIEIKGIGLMNTWWLTGRAEKQSV